MQWKSSFHSAFLQRENPYLYDCDSDADDDDSTHSKVDGKYLSGIWTGCVVYPCFAHVVWFGLSIFTEYNNLPVFQQREKIHFVQFLQTTSFDIHEKMGFLFLLPVSTFGYKIWRSRTKSRKMRIYCFFTFLWECNTTQLRAKIRSFWVLLVGGRLGREKGAKYIYLDNVLNAREWKHIVLDWTLVFVRRYGLVTRKMGLNFNKLVHEQRPSFQFSFLKSGLFSILKLWGEEII